MTWDGLVEEYLHRFVMRKTHKVLVVSMFDVGTCDEVTIVTEKKWISIHAYVIP